MKIGINVIAATLPSFGSLGAKLTDLHAVKFRKSLKILSDAHAPYVEQLQAQVKAAIEQLPEDATEKTRKAAEDAAIEAFNEGLKDEEGQYPQEEIALPLTITDADIEKMQCGLTGNDLDVLVLLGVYKESA